jgi:hypothetical protein
VPPALDPLAGTTMIAQLPTVLMVDNGASVRRALDRRPV